MSLELLVISGPDKGKAFILNLGKDHLLGRDPKALYKLTDPCASRNHCLVMLEGGEVTVTANEGRTTHVNGQLIQTQTLKPGDILKVGETELLLHLTDKGGTVVPQIQSELAPSKQASASERLPSLEGLESLVGKKLAHYEINTLIGTGKSSVVFHANDTKDNRSAALKVLHPEFSSNQQDMDRFIRAMQQMLPLRHPNLIAVYAAGKTASYCWVAMEYVAGENLRQVIERIGVANMLDWKNAYRVAVHIGRALEYAQERSIVHRNITPTNILRDATDKTAKLGDLMLAKATEGTMQKEITRKGEILGDMDYMSPERTSSTGKLDGRSDLYSLGATLYALLTGRPPCTGKTIVEKAGHICHSQPEKPTKFHMGIPPALESFVLKLLAKKPEDRYQTATEMLNELSRIGRFNGVAVD